MIINFVSDPSSQCRSSDRDTRGWRARPSACRCGIACTWCPAHNEFSKRPLSRPLSRHVRPLTLGIHAYGRVRRFEGELLFPLVPPEPVK